MNVKVGSIILLSLGIFLSSCNGEEKITASENNEIYSNDEFRNEVEEVISEEIAGEYFGILPCADCEGIETTVVINTDGSYQLTSHYLTNREGQTTFENEGMINWEKENNRMIFISMTDTTQLYFQIGENEITQLDIEGEQIEGELASKYVLLKRN